jgi:hypothetical protein
MKPAAGLVKLAARRPARECLLGDRPLLPARYSVRVPCCSLPRPTSRRAYRIPAGVSRHCTTVSVAASSSFYVDGDSQHPRLQPIPSCLRRTRRKRPECYLYARGTACEKSGWYHVVQCASGCARLAQGLCLGHSDREPNSDGSPGRQ